VIASFTSLVACVQLDGNRASGRGTVRFIDVVASGTGGRPIDGDFFWNLKSSSNVNDSPYACMKNEQEIR